MTYLTKPTPRILPTPREIVAQLDRYVYGQFLAKRDLAVAVYNHYLGLGYHDRNPATDMCSTGGLSSRAAAPFGKQHILLMGPTGSGKTYLIRLIAELLGVPWIFCAATSLVQTGYVGTRIENAIGSLYLAAGKDRRATERGIILIDEIDKIASHGRSGGPDVSGEGVQQALLSVLDGRVVQTSSGGSGDFVMGEVDTSTILFVGAGAFVGLAEKARRRRLTGSIGFVAGGTVAAPGRRAPAASLARGDELLYRESADDLPDTEDLVSFGFIPEFVGRFATLTATHELTADDLVSVLESAEESVLPRQRRLFEVHGIDLDFTPGALRAVAEEACRLGTGARGLNRAVLRSLAEVDYRLPELAAEGIIRVTVTAEAVRGRGEVALRRAHTRPRGRRTGGRHRGQPDTGPGGAGAPAVRAPCQTEAEELRAVALAIPGGAAGDGADTAFTDPRMLSSTQVRERLEAVKRALLWDRQSLTSRTWWERFEAANSGSLHIVLQTAEDMRQRRCQLNEFFSAYICANTENVKAVFLFLEYLRAKDGWKKRQQAERDEATRGAGLAATEGEDQDEDQSEDDEDDDAVDHDPYDDPYDDDTGDEDPTDEDPFEVGSDQDDDDQDDTD